MYRKYEVQVLASCKPLTAEKGGTDCALGICRVQTQDLWPWEYQAECVAHMATHAVEHLELAPPETYLISLTNIASPKISIALGRNLVKALKKLHILTLSLTLGIS